jgi:hypothetical protein
MQMKGKTGFMMAAMAVALAGNGFSSSYGTEIRGIKSDEEHKRIPGRMANGKRKSKKRKRQVK